MLRLLATIAALFALMLLWGIVYTRREADRREAGICDAGGCGGCAHAHCRERTED